MHKNTNRLAKGLMLGAAGIAFQSPGCTVDQAMLQDLLGSLVADGGSISLQLGVDGSGSVGSIDGSQHDGSDDGMDDSVDDGLDDGIDSEDGSMQP